MSKRKTIGENPLDAVVPDPKGQPKAKSRPARPEAEPEDGQRQAKERLTVHLPLQLIDRMRNAVYWTPGLTLAGLAEDAIAKAVDRMEKERGEAFSMRKGRIKAGRPPK